MEKTPLSNSQRTEKTESPGPRVLFLGTTGDFSVPPLAALLADGLAVCAVVMPASGSASSSSAPIIRREPPGVGRGRASDQRERECGNPVSASARRRRRLPLPMLTPFINRTIAQMAWERGIPVIEAGALASAPTLEALAAFRPDVICVACFPRRLPSALLALPPLGCVNLHPSLLPAYRGPSPGFWVLRNGEQYTGATIHLMDERLDTGDILLQASFEIPDGITSAALEQRCAEAGAPLLARAVRALAAGTASRTPQPAEGSSYYSWPKDEDFSVSVTRPARWAFNFIRGVADWGGPLALRVGAERFPVRQALDYQPEALLGQPYRRQGDELWAQCAPGVLHARLSQVN